MFRARIELATSLKSCLSQLLRHAELWLTVVQRKSFNVILHNFEKRCKMRHIFCTSNLSRAVCCAKNGFSQYGYRLLLYLYCMPIMGDMSYLVSEIKIETCHLMSQLVIGM
jgi:hypothetical protein